MHKPEIILRPATIDDTPALAALAQELSASEGRRSFANAAALTEAAFGTSPHCRFLVAQHEEAVVGMVMFYPGYDLESASCGFHLGDIIVTATHRGQGIGTQLMQALARCAREEGKLWVSWTLLQENTLAQQFYTHLGAHRIGVHFMALGPQGLQALAG